MTDTEIVPRKRDREPPDRPPLVDAERGPRVILALRVTRQGPPRVPWQVL